MDKGLPLTFAKWLRDFLSTRQARVQINGEHGRPVPLGQGLPQGSVLLPLLFLLYSNDLKTVAPNGVEAAMSAVSVTLFCHPCKLPAQAVIQEAVTRTAEWSRHHNMTLNAEKFEVAFFTSNLHIYKAPYLRVLMYRAPAWQPWLAANRWNIWNAVKTTHFL